jgi:hypothetical protein
MEAVLDIGFPFLMAANCGDIVGKEIMYTRYQSQRLCLHSSIFDIASQYQVI